MAEEIKNCSQEFIVHFDVSDHRLTIDEFYQTAKTVQVLTDSFNQLLFDKKPLIGVYVKPPKNGGIIETLELVCSQHPLISLVVVPCGLLFLEGIIKDLSGMNIGEMGQAFSAQTRQLFQDIIISANHDYQQLRVDIPIGLDLLKGSIETFLQKKASEIRKIEGSNNIPIEASLAKNKFYTMCARSGRIKGISFSKSHTFPIKQNDFSKYVEVEPIQTDDVQRRYVLHEVTIIAPVNVQDSQVQWKTKDKRTSKKVSFLMADDKFRKEFFGGLYPLKETKKDDEMLVYVEYITTIHPNGTKSEKRQAIKVFRFNDREIAPVPENIKLNIPNLTADPRQGTLFNMKEIGTKK